VRIGIIGLPQCGKSAVFTAVTGVAVRAGTREPHLGVVHVPDERLDRLCEIESSAKRTPPEVSFVDMAPMNTESHTQAEDFVKWIRDADAFLVVMGGALAGDEASDLGDLDRVLQELLLSDLVSIEGRLERIEKDLSRGKREAERERDKLAILRGILESGVALRNSAEAMEILPEFQGFAFLSARPLFVVYNRPLSVGARADESVLAGVESRGLSGLAFDAAFEKELLDLDEESRVEFMASEGVEEFAADRVIRSCYETLDLVTFYTAGPKESRAIAIRRGTSAYDAAGKIHSDIQKGFVRTEVVSYEAINEAGSWNGAKTAGKFRLEGREYPIRDGDVVYFRFTS
jgi:ribosome-binding ATPase